MKRNPEGTPRGEEALVCKLGLFDSTMIVMGIVAVAIPVYFYWKRKASHEFVGK